MKTRMIGYGRSVVPCDFMSSQSCRETFYKEVCLEDWENEGDCLELLRSQINGELGINEDIKYLRQQKQELLAELKVLESLVDAARKQWTKIQAFQSKLGLVEEDSIPF